MAAAKRNAIIELFWKIHPRIYRWTGGRVGGKILNLPVLLLTTAGRHSGERRTKALMYLPDGKAYVVIASFLGEPRHPAWWLNLQKNPRAEILVGRRSIPVAAREADGAERERLWNEIAVPRFATGHDGVLVGHFHHAHERRESGREFFVLGDWIDHFTYVELTDGRLEMKVWPQPV